MKIGDHVRELNRSAPRCGIIVERYVPEDEYPGATAANRPNWAVRLASSAWPLVHSFDDDQLEASDEAVTIDIGPEPSVWPKPGDSEEERERLRAERRVMWAQHAG